MMVYKGPGVVSWIREELVDLLVEGGLRGWRMRWEWIARIFIGGGGRRG
ncbi:hypothetical protein ACHAXS_000304 [Conticribra weissflogii]